MRPNRKQMPIRRPVSEIRAQMRDEFVEQLPREDRPELPQATALVPARGTFPTFGSPELDDRRSPRLEARRMPRGRPWAPALPDRRQQPRLPRLLRPARVDRDQRRAADQRDLRPRLDAGENHRRAPPAGASCVAWDAGLCSGREDTYDLYKAQRKPRPDLLREQWPHLMPLVEAFGYTNVKVDGYEADDVIASLVKQAREEGIEVMVVTGDRDAYQLVDEGVRVMSTSRGITETKIYDRAAVEERYGVPPELITDLMGLRGDTSDNIPGVPGIGEKTATQLLQQFGSLDEVLASVDQISGAKRKQNLTEHADDARMSKQLATLQYDIETGVDLGAAMASEPDRGALRDFMREFELRAVLERLEEALPEGDGGPRPQGRDRARGRGGGGQAGGPRRGAGGAGDRRRPLGGGRSRPRPRRLLAPSTSSRSPSAPSPSPPTTPSPSAAAATACSPPRRARGSSRTSTTTRWSPPTCWSRSAAPTTWSSWPPTPASASPRAPPPRSRRRTTGSWRWARSWRPGSTPPRKRAWSPPSPPCRRRGSRSSGWRSCCARSSCRWSRCWRRWSARG